MRFLLPLILVLATCWASPNPLYDDVPPQFFEEATGDYRLPKNVEASAYKIDLDVYFDTEKGERDFYYEGVSVISLIVKEKTEYITFHAKDLDISKAHITYTGNEEVNYVPISIKVTNLQKDDQKEFVTVKLEKEITPEMNEVRLVMAYTKNLTDESHGFYKRSYEDENGKEKWLAATHFEPVSARRAFPCWDEPQIKAYFTITITPPSANYTVISNMVVNGDPDKKTGATTFMKTPKMSTYLVAFVIADYKRRESKDKSYGVWTKPHEIESADFAYKFGEKTIKEMNKFTDISYYDNGMKMDQIAIPNFGPGAMENWGLVMYRESGLLITDETTTKDKQDIGTVIAHELSHQWFGNLVTCEWWNYIWLNEGFATFFQYYITEEVLEDEDWKIMEQFIIRTLQPAFVVDSSDETHALEPEIELVKTPTQISNMFDDISYKKGGSILRMMRQFLGEKVFQNGLRAYLKLNSKQSVTSRNLFNAFEIAEPKKVREILPEKKSLAEVMKNWMKAPGYPVVTVSANDIYENRFDVTQDRFFLVEPMKYDNIEWYIPITYVTEKSPKNEETMWLIPNENVRITHTEKEKWLLFNKDQTGYYRVNYDENNWKLLSTYLVGDFYRNISTINRAQLIDDALNLARAGRLKYEVALGVTKFLSKEVEYVPWYTAVKAFEYLDNVLQGSNAHAPYKQYVAQSIEAFAKSVNYTELEPKKDNHMQKLSRVLALNTACKYELKACEEFVSNKLKEWLEPEEDENGKVKEKKLPIDYRSTILCGGLRKADQATFDNVVKKYKDSKNENEKMDILAGLGCVVSEDIIKIFLNFTLESKYPIGVFEAMNSISTGNSASLNIIIQFINENLKKILNAETSTDDEYNKKFTSLLHKLATKVINAEQFMELSLLCGKLQKHSFEVLSYALNNLAWAKSNREDVENWMKTQSKPEDDNNSANSVTMSLFLVIVPVLFARLY